MLRVTCVCFLGIYVIRTVDSVPEVFFRHGCNGGLSLVLLRFRGVRGCLVLEGVRGVRGP